MDGLRRTSMIIALLALAACGGQDPTPPDPTSLYVGEWTFDNGIGSASCPDGDGHMPVPFRFNAMAATFTKIGAGALSGVLTRTSCTLTFTATTQAATADPGQTCSLPLELTPPTQAGSAGTTTVAVTSWVMTKPNQQLELSLAGAAEGCAVTGSGVLSRR